ncbi:hypothetical protein [Kiritimatiella glycovorans]|uniref:Uncharacterized protein n=1 Tax=Kiritimatiella glycovorans TaxID=1307763 RepID=A0A0G3EDW8_9BACT|nr:hypothetical protein [Kiritimatiella glycovorans]AKJ64503.1 hypothetical protein L21SP4_01255 [Kiritimatiella glycovorans]
MADLGPYRHRSFYPKSWLWWVAFMFFALGVIIFYGLSEHGQNYDTERLQWLVLFVCLAISGICAIVATASRWFYR